MTDMLLKNGSILGAFLLVVLLLCGNAISLVAVDGRGGGEIDGGATGVHDATNRDIDPIGLPAELEEDAKTTIEASTALFTENRGQLGREDVLYYARTSSGQVGLIRDGVLMKVQGIDGEGCLLKTSFEGHNDVEPAGRGRSSSVSNFFLGSEESKWCTDVSRYYEVVYEGLWDGIDLVYYVYNDGLKYDLILHPGARVEDIRMSVEGHDALSVGLDGLTFTTSAGMEIRDTGLSVFYADGEQEEIGSRFVLLNGDTYSFILDEYDHSRTVVIDPVIYSTYLGGLLNEGFVDLLGGGVTGGDIAVDAIGNAYVTGWTQSIDFPTTPGAYNETYAGMRDVFLSKLDPSGSILLYSTYIGGTNDDSGYAIALDDSGNIYIAGSTASANLTFPFSSFPTTSGVYLSPVTGGQLVFVSKLNSHGNSLLYSTCIGGKASDFAYGIVVDDDGNAHVVGGTYSFDFPTTAGALDPVKDVTDVSLDTFIFKLGPTASSLWYSTFLGGTWDEGGLTTRGDIALDDEGCVYVTGGTSSPDFPTTSGAFE
ncbi:MAG: SBBP repeat-containing protein, partial [Thermoplasmata archaeon]|nr:SBBP repeat-containing protein [Thermoplasmata archaeon]